MPALDPEAGVALGVAGGAQHVVDARRVVLLQQQDRPPVVGDEVLARPREQPVDVHAGVLGRVVLGDVVGPEGERVGDLAALHVDHAHALAGGHAHPAALAGRDVDRRHGRANLSAVASGARTRLRASE